METQEGHGLNPLPPDTNGSPPASDEPALTDLRELCRLAVERRASDIHLTEHSPPLLRIHGELTPLKMAPLTREDTKRLVYRLLSDQQRAQFEQELELDVSIAVPDVARFRVNVHLQRGSVEAAMRLVSSRIPSLQELGLPAVVAELTRKSNGLVLVTGPTGVGKTTTLAAMVDLINHERAQHIIVIEDPIEYLHCNARSVIKQREVHGDTKSFSSALVHALRQDPNVIVVGEMRDLNTISTTLTAAETGHLVLATLHMADAAQTVDRIVDVFPSSRQSEVKIQLADCLQGVVSQQLLPRADAPGRVPVYEVMVATPAIRNLIREHQTQQLHTVMLTGAAHGMITMDACLKQLYDRGIIAYETAISHMKHPTEYALLADPPPDVKKKRPWSHTPAASDQ